MAAIEVKCDVVTRDEFGRFQQHCLEAARKTAEDAARVGAMVARAAATKKSGAMAATIRASNATGSGIGGGRTATAEFTVGTDHWQFQEAGTSPHPITGRVRFFWEREGRMWKPGPNVISHPGNRAVHFMDRGYEAAKAELIAGMNRNYRI